MILLCVCVCVCVGFVMALQFRYQRAKMYRKVALGLKHHMSVSHGKDITRDCIISCKLAFSLFSESKFAIKNLLLGLACVYVSGNLLL